MTDTLSAALYSIHSDARETWVSMAMALKSELGPSGFSLWDEWSRQSESYRAPDARAVWRSVKANGGITIATLYHEAKAHGWQGEKPATIPISDDERRRRAEMAAFEERLHRKREREASDTAHLLGRVHSK